MLSASWWHRVTELKFILQVRTFPSKIPLSLIFLFSLLLLSHFSSDPLVVTHMFQHAFAMWLIVCLEKIPLRKTVLPFYFNDESGKLPRWNIYYTKCILLKRKLTRDTSGNYMYLQYVDLSFSPFCETSVTDLANIFDLWLVIWNQPFEFQICASMFI